MTAMATPVPRSARLTPPCEIEDVRARLEVCKHELENVRGALLDAESFDRSTPSAARERLRSLSHDVAAVRLRVEEEEHPDE